MRTPYGGPPYAQGGTTQSQNDHDTWGWLPNPTNKVFTIQEILERELELTGDKIVVIPQHVDVFHDFILIVGILYTLGSFRPSDPIIFKETLPNPLIPYCGLDSTTWQQKAYVWTNWKALRSKMVIQFNTPLQDATMCSHAPIPKDLSVHIYVREEPAVRCRWTGRVWEITGRSSRLQQIYQPFQRNL